MVYLFTLKYRDVNLVFCKYASYNCMFVSSFKTARFFRASQWTKENSHVTLCRQFANSVLPCYPGSNVENNLWQRPSNKSIQDLIKGSGGAARTSGSFPSKHQCKAEISCFNLALLFSCNFVPFLSYSGPLYI